MWKSTVTNKAKSFCWCWGEWEWEWEWGSTSWMWARSHGDSGGTWHAFSVKWCATWLQRLGLVRPKRSARRGDVLVAETSQNDKTQQILLRNLGKHRPLRPHNARAMEDTGNDSGLCDAVRNLTLSKGFIPPANRPTGATVQSVQFVVEMTLLCGFVLCFAYFKHLHPHRQQLSRLHSRPLGAVVLICLGTSFVAITGSYFWSHDLHDGVPCYVQILASPNAIAFLLFPTLLRLYRFYGQDQLTQVLASNNNNSNGKVETDGTISEVSTFASRLHFRRWCFCLWRRGENTDERLHRLRSRTSKTTLTLLLVGCLTPYLVSSFVFIALQDGVYCYGCSLSTAGKYVILTESAVAVAMCGLFIWLVNDKQDSFGTLYEIRTSIKVAAIPAILAYVLHIALGVRGDFSFHMLMEIFLVLFCYLQSVHQCVLAARQYRLAAHARHQCQMSIADFERLVVGQNGPYYLAFCKHLEMEHAMESMAFINAARLFSETFSDVSIKTSQSRARKIIATYVGDDAAVPCNLSGPVVEALRAPGLEPRFGMFAPAEEELCLMLYRDAFTRFLATKPFQDIFQAQQSTLVAAATATTA